jgi:hypothetical protein
MNRTSLEPFLLVGRGTVCGAWRLSSGVAAGGASVARGETGPCSWRHGSGAARHARCRRCSRPTRTAPSSSPSAPHPGYGRPAGTAATDGWASRGPLRVRDVLPHEIPFRRATPRARPVPLALRDHTHAEALRAIAPGGRATAREDHLRRERRCRSPAQPHSPTRPSWSPSDVAGTDAARASGVSPPCSRDGSSTTSACARDCAAAA